MGPPLTSNPKALLALWKKHPPPSPPTEEQLAARAGLTVAEYRRQVEEAARKHAEWLASIPKDDPMFDI